MMHTAIALLLVVGPALAQETKDGDKPKVSLPAVQVPEHLWKDFAVGTSVTYKTNSAGTEMEMTTILLWKDDKGYVVRTDVVLSGTKVDGQPIEYVVGRVTSDGSGDPEAPKPRITEGDEETEVPAGRFRCHWTQVETEKPVPCMTKTWTAREIPGGMVKMESETSGMKTTMALLRVEKK